MLLYVFRHGEAEVPPNTKTGAKAERHLTPAGRHWVAEVVSLAERELGFRPELILSSPLARARETAEIAHQTISTKPEIAIDDCLLGDAQVKDMYRALRKRKDAGSIALVTHLPLLDHLLGDLLGAESNIDLYSGAIACVRCKSNPGHAKGSLLWLLPPRQWFDGKQWR